VCPRPSPAINSNPARIRQSVSPGTCCKIEDELRTAGRVVALPSERQAEAALRKIADPRSEPQTFADRRSVLEAIQDLRMEYYDGELTIEGKVPVPLPATQDDKKINCNSGLGADPERRSLPSLPIECWSLFESGIAAF